MNLVGILCISLMTACTITVSLPDWFGEAEPTVIATAAVDPNDIGNWRLHHGRPDPITSHQFLGLLLDSETYTLATGGDSCKPRSALSFRRG